MSVVYPGTEWSKAGQKPPMEIKYFLKHAGKTLIACKEKQNIANVSERKKIISHWEETFIRNC